MITIIDKTKFDESFVNYDRGWIIDKDRGGKSLPYITVSGCDATLTWSNEHEELHEEPSKSHFIDKYERRQVINLLRNYLSGKNNIVCELGCSTGYMLEDMIILFPQNIYIGSDLFENGLIKSYKRHPEIMHVQSDICDIPIRDSSVDIVVSLNVLEHIQDDRKALQEIHRILKPEGVACLVVPYGAELYDYYDEVMLHQRRYGKNELREKCMQANFRILFENYLAAFGWPFFRYKKNGNRKNYSNLSLKEKENLVKRDIESTKDSTVGHVMMAMESLLFNRVQYPWGIRNIVLLKKCRTNE